MEDIYFSLSNKVLCVQVSFCGKSNEAKQFFGLVTTRREIVEKEPEENDGNDNDTEDDMVFEEVFSTSCHVFMTEVATSDDEVRRRANAFQIEPTPVQTPVSGAGAAISGHGGGAAALKDLEYKEFPANADPIIETIENLYKKVSEVSSPVPLAAEEENVYENVSPPPSSNSDSGIGFKDTATIGGGAMGGGALGPPPGAGAGMAPDQDMLLLEDPEESFNTERLESQNSADNLRQSMQRYLATKHQHLKKASEQLLSNRPSEFRQSLGLPPYQPPPRPPGGPASLIAEDKNSNFMSAVAPPAGAATEPPPQLYKNNLAKSHDELLSLSTKENQDEVLHPPAASGGGGASVGGGGSQPTSQGALICLLARVSSRFEFQAWHLDNNFDFDHWSKI